jgi:hypothetical protein
MFGPEWSRRPTVDLPILAQRVIENPDHKRVEAFCQGS